MQDINGLIKEYDNDNLLLDTLKHFINDLNKIMGRGEIPENVLDKFATNNTEGFGMAFNMLKNVLGGIAQGGGSSGGGQLSSFPMNFVDGKGKYLQCEEFDEICDVKRIQFTVTYSNQAKTETGGFNVGTYSRSSDCVEGILPCLYSDNNGSHTGVLKFDSDMNITLFPSETVTQLDGEITFEISGVLSIGTIEGA